MSGPSSNQFGQYDPDRRAKLGTGPFFKHCVKCTVMTLAVRPISRHPQDNGRCQDDHPSGSCLKRPTWEQTQVWRANGGLGVPSDRLVFDATQPKGAAHLGSGGSWWPSMQYYSPHKYVQCLVVCNVCQRVTQTRAQTTPTWRAQTLSHLGPKWLNSQFWVRTNMLHVGP